MTQTDKTADLGELVAELRGLLEAATPGPWEAGLGSITNWHDCTFEMEWLPNGTGVDEDGNSVNERAKEDAELIVRAVNALPTLLDALAAECARAEEYKRLMLKVSESCVEFEDRAEALEKERDALRAAVSVGLDSRMLSDAATANARADKAEAEVAALKARVEADGTIDEGVLQEALDRAFADAHGLILRPATAVTNILGRSMARHIADVLAEFSARTQAEGKGS